MCLLLVAILLVSATTYAWMILSKAPQVTGVSAMIGANGNLEIALTTTEHLAALKANDMYDDEPNSELANGDILHDNVLWGNMVDLNSSDYGLSTLNMRPAVLNVVNGCVADAPISIAKYGTDGRVEHVNSDPNNIDLSTLGFTGVFRTDKGDYFAGNVSMSMNDLQSGNYDKEAMVQSVLDNREYGVRVAGPLDYTALTNEDQTVANIDLVIDDYCFAIDLLFRTNASEASLFLQTDAIERVDNEDYEYLVDFSGSGSYIEIANPQLSSAIRVVFADTLTGQVYALAQADPNGKLYMTARMDENGNPVAVKPGDDPLIKPLTQNQVSAITTWVYLDGTLIENRDAATTVATALKMNLQFCTDIDLTPARPDGNSDYVRPVDPDEPSEPDEPDTPSDPDAVSGIDGNITWIYTPSNKTLRLSGSGDMKNYEPNAAPWYYLRDEIATVIIDEGITSIGDRAFYYSYALTSVTIPDSVTTIGHHAFVVCSTLTSVTIPDSVTTIGEHAFYDCSSLTSVTIGDSVTTIGGAAFRNCTSLTSVTIPDNVTSIGDVAFYGCSSLTSVTIPNSVTSIGEHAFSYCYSLTDVYYNGSLAQWVAINIGGNNDKLTDATIHFTVTD